MVKTANGHGYEAEFKFLEASYGEDVGIGALPEQLNILEVMLRRKYHVLTNPVGGVKVPRTREEANSESPNIYKLLAVNPATSTAGEH